MWRIIDSVPGSEAAAPNPMINRPAMSTLTLGATAAIKEPVQNTATPPSMILLRPKRSPKVPNVSMRLAKTSAEPLTTHCTPITPVCRSLWTLASTTLTIVVSKNVRNSTNDKVARAARGRDRVAVGAIVTAPIVPRPGSSYRDWRHGSPIPDRLGEMQAVCETDGAGRRFPPPPARRERPRHHEPRSKERGGE